MATGEIKFRKVGKNTILDTQSWSGKPRAERFASKLPPPMRLSRDLLIRGITYKLQERAYGGLSLAAARKLE